MKKTKLITALGMLVLTIACLTIGVYSAIKTTFTASGTITFNAYGLDVVVEGTISGVIANDTSANLTYKGATLSQHDDTTVDVGTNGNLPQWTIGDIAFDELNGNIRSFIIIKITNYSPFPVTATFGDITVPSGISSYTNSINTNHIYAKEYEDIDADSREMVVVLSGDSATGTNNSFSINVSLAPSTYVEDRDASHYNIVDGVLTSVFDTSTSSVTTYAYSGTNADLIIPQKINGTKITGIYCGDWMLYNNQGYSWHYYWDFSNTQKNFTCITFPNTFTKVNQFSPASTWYSLSNSCITVENDTGASNICLPTSCTSLGGWGDSGNSFKTIIALANNFEFSAHYSLNITNCYFNGKLENFTKGFYSTASFEVGKITTLNTLDYTGEHIFYSEQ